VTVAQVQSATEEEEGEGAEEEGGPDGLPEAGRPQDSKTPTFVLLMVRFTQL
jgi:hypothetical protein